MKPMAPVTMSVAGSAYAGSATGLFLKPSLCPSPIAVTQLSPVTSCHIHRGQVWSPAGLGQARILQ